MSTAKAILAIVAVSILVSCSTGTPTTNPTAIPVQTRAITPTSTPTAIPVRLPVISLSPGQFYFSIGGKPGLVFSRNIIALYRWDYTTLFNFADAGGTKVVRFGLEYNSVMGGLPFTNTGELNEKVVSNIEGLLDEAEAHGIYVMMWFTGAGDWNMANNWAKNPFNAANGGPAQNSTDVFQEGSPTNTIWFEYVNRLVTRWHNRKNILAWEVLGEANLINESITEAQAIAFVDHMAQVIHAADPNRLITASLADFGDWSNFLSNDSIDFINFHPYPVSGKLDSTIITEARFMLAKYGKPVLIGESGLSFLPPYNDPPTLTTADRADIGIKHAIWAAVVAGTMNSRAFWWEDSYGVCFPALGAMRWVQKYADVEAPAVRFVEGVDMTGFKPIAALASDKIFGATLGNENLIIGWYRDATSEPPNWNLQPVVSKQTVTITVPGNSTNWQVDFYDTKTGTDIVSSAIFTRKGNSVIVNLPDFTDDIAFKMMAQAGSVSTLVSTTTDTIAGKWSGTITSSSGAFSTLVNLEIQPGCQVGRVCGIFSAPQLPCSGTLFLKEITGETFVFIEQDSTGSASCISGGYEYLQPLSDGTLSYRFLFTPDSIDSTNGILYRP